LVTVPLAVATFSVAKSSSAQSQISDVTLDWLDSNQSDLELDEVNVFNNNVEIILHGSANPEPISELREDLEEAFPQMEDATLRINVARSVPIPETTAEE
jgi:hypothetical protein